MASSTLVGLIWGGLSFVIVLAIALIGDWGMPMAVAAPCIAAGCCFGVTAFPRREPYESPDVTRREP